MSDFKAKMHQIRFQLGLRLRPRWGAYSAPQTSWLYLRGLLLRGGRERGRGREWGKDREGDGKGGKGGDGKGIGGREGGEGMGACMCTIGILESRRLCVLRSVMHTDTNVC